MARSAGPSSRVRYVLVLLFGAAIVLAMSVPSASASRSKAALPAAPAGQSTDPSLTHRVVEQLKTLGESRFSSTYGGIELQDNESTIVVHLTKLDAGVQDAFAAVSSGLKIDFETTSHSQAEVYALHEAISSDSNSLKSSGIDLRAWGPDPDTGIEDVGVRGLTDAQQRLLENKYGASNVHVYNLTDAAADAPRNASRTSDSSPWHPGDVISGFDRYDVLHYAFCTSGYGIYFNSGGKRLLTAAHCYLPDPGLGPVYNTSQTNPADQSRPIGPVVNDTFNQSQTYPMDVEIIDAIPKTSVWGGVPSSPVEKPIVGRLTSTVGDYVCVDGATAGQVCAEHILAVNQCLAFSDGKHCHLVITHPDTFPTRVLQGDSGGPVFSESGSNVYAVGIVDGFADYPGGVHEDFYTDITNFLTAYGAHLCYQGGCP